jgi:hypothetical protein
MLHREKIQIPKRCGAKARTRNKLPCRHWGMPNGRCWLHGGKSTGPRTPEGLERSRRSSWKDGKHSAQAIVEHKKFRKLYRSARALILWLRDNNDSLSADELTKKLNELQQLQDDMGQVMKEFKYPQIRDQIACYRILSMGLEIFYVSSNHSLCRSFGMPLAGRPKGS